MSFFEHSPNKKEHDVGGWCGSFESIVPEEDLHTLRIEDEVRVKNFDANTLIEQLLERGGEKIFEGHIIDERFELRQVNIAEKFGSAVRIRTLTDLTGKTVFEMTLKGRKVNQYDTLDIIEYNKLFDTYDAAYQAMLDMLERHYSFDEKEDVYVAKSTEKERVSIQVGPVIIDVDNPIARTIGNNKVDLKDMPPYAEFEVLHALDVSDAEREALAAKRDALIKELGYERAPEDLQHGLASLIEAFEKEEEKR